MSQFFDTHAHLNSLTHFPDYPCVNVTATSSEWSKAVAIYHNHKNIYPALGIHPWFVTEQSIDDLEALQILVSKKDIVAIGEIGLDYSDNYKSTKYLQLDVFERQLNIASKYDLPVSLHCVKAHNDLIAVLKQFKGCLVGVVHGLGASSEIVSQYLNLGLKIGINGVVCRDNARRYHEMVKNYALDNFVLETDFPNIRLPGTNEALLADIDNVATQVAILTNTSKADVIKKTNYNATQIFKR